MPSFPIAIAFRIPGRGILAAWLAALLCGVGATGAKADEAALTAVRSGNAVMLMRHPGSEAGVGECDSGPYLNDRQRGIVEAMAERLREGGLTTAAVRSSADCRALATAEALDLGEVGAAAWLDSFAAERLRAKARTRAARDAIREHDGRRDGPLLLITHETNITRLSGIYPREGEIVIVERPIGTPARVLARLRP